MARGPRAPDTGARLPPFPGHVAKWSQSENNNWTKGNHFDQIVLDQGSTPKEKQFHFGGHPCIETNSYPEFPFPSIVDTQGLATLFQSRKVNGCLPTAAKRIPGIHRVEILTKPDFASLQADGRRWTADDVPEKPKPHPPCRDSHQTETPPPNLQTHTHTHTLKGE